MSIYERMKDKFDSVKPIRGTTIKPIGKRTRKHETIEQVGDSYAAKLYNTHCVVYHPDDTFSVMHGSWPTPTTTSFITRMLPTGVFCVKVNSTLWVYQHNNGRIKYPIGEGPTVFRMVDGVLTPAGDAMIKRRLVDRRATKVLQDKLKPFLRFTETFLSMSDGWVMHDTIKQHFEVASTAPQWGGWPFLATPSPSGRAVPGLFARPSPHMGPPLLETSMNFMRRINSVGLVEQFTDYLTTMPEEDFLYGLCMMAVSSPARVDTRVAETVPLPNGAPVKFVDVKLDYNKFRSELFKYITKRSDVHKIVTVEPTDKFLTKVA